MLVIGDVLVIGCIDLTKAVEIQKQKNTGLVSQLGGVQQGGKQRERNVLLFQAVKANNAVLRKSRNRQPALPLQLEGCKVLLNVLHFI